MQDESTPPAMAVEQRVFGHAVRETRARRGLSQAELGRLTGKHHNYIGALERGEVNPTFKTMMGLAAGLDVSLVELVALYAARRSEIA